MVSARCLTGFGALCAQAPHSLKGRSKSSQEWITRQLKDPFVERAKLLNYRCRSAFKLLEIDDKYGLLKPGICVLDCGAAPGSWTQVAVERVKTSSKETGKAHGLVVGIDRLLIHPVDGAVLLGGHDFTLASSQDKLREALEGRQVDLVLSDMAPNASGLKQTDHDNIISLAYAVTRLSLSVSREGANLLVKLWDGGSTNKLTTDLARFYSSVKIVKPIASRSDSAEIFVLARNFVGATKVTK